MYSLKPALSLSRVARCGRWGCKLSQKLFVGKEYVLKHVRNKHTAVMEAKQQEVLLSFLYSVCEGSS